MSIFTDKAIKYIPRLQKDLSLPERFHAAAIFGSIGTETGGFKYMQEIKPTVAGSAGGFGWEQWTGMKNPTGRRYQFFDFCKKNNLDPVSDEANYRFIVWEGLNTEKYSISKLRQTKTIEEATETYMKLDLRPGAPHLQDRIKWAKIALNASPSTATSIVKSPITQTTGGIVAGGAIATQVAPTSWMPYIIYSSISILLLTVVIYTIYKYIQYKRIPNGTNVSKSA